MAFDYSSRPAICVVAVWESNSKSESDPSERVRMQTGNASSSLYKGTAGTADMTSPKLEQPKYGEEIPFNLSK